MTGAVKGTMGRYVRLRTTCLRAAQPPHQRSSPPSSSSFFRAVRRRPPTRPSTTSGRSPPTACRCTSTRASRRWRARPPRWPTEILSRHEARYGQKVGRVQLVIVDADDQPNGFASPLPFPLVTIRAVAPDGSDDFGNHEGWLRLVLTHELAHTVHLEEARGPVGLRAEGLRPRAVPLPEHPRHVVDDRGPRDLRGDRAHGLRPRPQPRLADGAAHGGARGALPEGGPGDLRARRVARRPGPVPLRRGVPAPADASSRARTRSRGWPASTPASSRPSSTGARSSKVTGTGLHAHWTAWADAGHRGGRAGRRRARRRRA